MGVGNETVQDGVGVGGVANPVMPGGQGKLRGDDRRSPAISLLEDFEQVVPGAGVERFEAEVIEDEQIGAAEGFDETRMTPIAAGERQGLAKFCPARVEQ